MIECDVESGPCACGAWHRPIEPVSARAALEAATDYLRAAPCRCACLGDGDVLECERCRVLSLLKNAREQSCSPATTTMYNTAPALAGLGIERGITMAAVISLSKEDAAYLAGLIDGEAYVGVTRATTSAAAKGCRRGVSYRAMISVRMTHHPVLDWALAATGVGSIWKTKEHPKYRQSWSWNIWSREAAALSQAVLPYLRVKAEHARNLIAFQRAMRFPGRMGLTDGEWEMRARFWERSRALTKGETA